MSKKKRKEGKVGGLNPLSTDIQILLERSSVYHKAGDLSRAKNGYDQILSKDPNHVDALQLSGLLARQQERFADAIFLLEKAINLNPRIATFHHNLAETHHTLGDLAKAELHYREALQLSPSYMNPKINLGSLLQHRGEFVEALEIFKSVVALCPEQILGQYNLASCYRTIGDTDSAIKHCRLCLQLDPTHIDAKLMMAGFFLSAGAFEEGWYDYEWRRYLLSSDEKFHHSIAPFPRWDGSSLANKRILLQAEQGLGDELMFATCISDVSKDAKDCLLECDQRLVRLFSRSFPDVTVIPKSTERTAAGFLENGSVDWRITVGSLPRFYRKTLSDFTSGDPYLVADQGLRKDWRLRLSSLGGRLKIGVSWYGGRDVAEQLVRSIPLSRWAPVFELSDIDFVNLQYGDHAKEISEFNAGIASSLVSFEEYNPVIDMDNAAALIAELDLVITIDNSTVHLAGALGTPVWLLLPYGSNWRWLKGRKDSCWYRSVKIFQQDSFGNGAWVKIIKQVAGALVESVSNAGGHGVFLGDKLIIPHRKMSPANCQKKLPAYKRKALLLNDTTSWYHWGCSCTSIAIHQQLNELGFSVVSIPINVVMSMASQPTSVEDFDSETFREIFERQYGDVVSAIEQSDVVVVNGEGSLHGLGSLPLKLLFLMYLSSKHLKTPVHLINHSCYPEDDDNISGLGNFIYQKVYSELAFCGAREVRSSHLLRELDIDVTMTFDCMPLFIERNFPVGKIEKDKSVVIAGSVAISDEMLELMSSCIQDLVFRGYVVKLLIGADAFPAADDLRFVSALGQLCTESFSVVNANSEMEWLTEICQARLLISGRFHHSIAATCLKTPFIALETNTPKLDALLEMLSLPWKVSIDDDDAFEQLMQMVDVLLMMPQRGVVDDAVCAELQRLSAGNFAGLKF